MSGLSIVAVIALPGLVVLALVAWLTRRQWCAALDARYRGATTDVVGEDDARVRAAFTAVSNEEARVLREFDAAIAAVAEAPVWHPEHLPFEDTPAGCACEKCDEAVADLDQWELELVDGEGATA